MGRRGSRLLVDMDAGRRAQLVRLGYDADEATELPGLHTRNFRLTTNARFRSVRRGSRSPAGR